MASNGPTDSPSGIPEIVLDTTLHDLLSREYDGPVPETLCHFKPNADRRYKEIPLNMKFIITSANIADGADLAHLQLENVSNLLMFWVGGGNVAYVASEGISDDQTLSRNAIDSTAKRNFSVLRPSQQPKIKTYANRDDFVNNYDGSPIRWGFAVDLGEELPALFSPEFVFKINSKRWLAVCGLKSANDSIIDCECSCPDHKTKDGKFWYYGEDECSQCSKTMEEEIERVREILENRSVPFVLKLTSSLGSVGTHIVQSEEDRKKVVEFITGENLPAYLPRITEYNAHIYPTALVVSDFIKGDTMALNFFIRKDGNPIFLGACHQLTTRTSTEGRQSTGLTYKDQSKHEMKYFDILKKIGQVLHKEGYFGPAGVDIMEDPGDGTLFVIDLNVRTPTSFTLYLLKGHCEKRGFGMGVVYECIILKISREDFESKFEKEFKEGRIVLMGSTRLGEKDAWAYPIILLGETKEDIDALSKRILKYEIGGEDEEAGAG